MKSVDGDSDDAIEDSKDTKPYKCRGCDLRFSSSRGQKVHENKHCKGFQAKRIHITLVERIDRYGLPNIMTYLNQVCFFSYEDKRTSDLASRLLKILSGNDEDMANIKNDVKGFENSYAELEALFKETRDKLDTEKDRAEEPGGKRDKSRGSSKGKDKRQKTAASAGGGSTSARW